MPTVSKLELPGGRFAVTERYDEAESTNEIMRRRFAEDETFEPFHTLVTPHQTAGRGRLQREWLSPAGASLAISTYVEFDAEAARESIGWLTLAAGVALRDALVTVAPEASARVSIKWPNDVLVDDRKVAGILGELLGVIDGGAKFAAVIGTGVNLRRPRGGFPFERAIALDEAGIETDEDALLATYVRALAARILELTEANGDADASGLRPDLLLTCSTIGSRVRVSKPADADLLGLATGIGVRGDLLVEDARGETHEINVGDIEHVRPESGGRE